MRRRLLLGISLTETLTVSFLMILVMGTIFAASSQTANVAKRVDGQSTRAGVVRIGMERLSNDIQVASAVLARYPLKTTAVFNCDEGHTLILKLPKFTSDMIAASDSYDVVIYDWSGENGDDDEDAATPLNLKRYYATVLEGVEAEPVLDRSICFDVVNLTMEFGAMESFVGNDYQVSFGLRGTPLAGTGEFKKAITLGGKDWSDSEYASFSGTTVQFLRAPRWGVPIDVTYGVDPSVPIDATGANAASNVSITVRERQTITDSKMKEKHRTVEYRIGGALRNR